MRCYAVHDVTTGRILYVGAAARDDSEDAGSSMAEQAGAGQAAIALADFPDASINYVLAGALTPRPACPISTATVGRVVTLSGVPVGAAYRITGAAKLSGVAADSTPAFTFGAAGTYIIAVDCFPAQDYSQQVTLA